MIKKICVIVTALCLATHMVGCLQYGYTKSESSENISLASQPASETIQSEAGDELLAETDKLEDIPPVKLSPTHISLAGPDSIPLTVDFVYATVSYCRISVDTGYLETTTGQSVKSTKVYSSNITEPFYLWPNKNGNLESGTVVDTITLESYDATGTLLDSSKILVAFNSESEMFYLSEIRMVDGKVDGISV